MFSMEKRTSVLFYFALLHFSFISTDAWKNTFYEQCDAKNHELLIDVYKIYRSLCKA